MLQESSVQTAVVFQYEDTLDSLQGLANTGRVRTALETARCDSLHVLPCEFSKPFSVLRVLQGWLEREYTNSAEPHITIDITCFTKLHLLLLLKTVEERLPQARIRVVYTEPLAYATAFGKSLSQGILDTFYLPLNSGDKWGERSALVIFLGHEPSRALRVIEEVEADETVLIHGTPGFCEDMSSVSERLNRHLLHQARYNAEFKLATSSAYDFLTTAELLCGILHKLREKNIDTFYLSPLGTKLQALAIDYLRRLEQSSRLILAYPAPLRYERKYYSQGVGPTYTALLIPAPRISQAIVREIDGSYRRE